MLSTRLFYAVSAPQSYFGYYYAFWAILCFLKTPLSSMRAYDDLLKLRNIHRTGNQIKCKPMPLHTFTHSDSHTLIRKFFLSIKRMDSIRKKWKFWDSNSGLPGYEPGVLTTELNFLSRKYYQHLKAIFSTVAILCHQPQQRLPFWFCCHLYGDPIRDVWSPFGQLRWARWVSEGLCEINLCQVHAQPGKRG